MKVLRMEVSRPRRWTDARAYVVRNVFSKLRDEFLGHENHVAGTQKGVLIGLLSVQDIVHAQFLNFKPARGNAVEEKNLRFGCGSEPAGNSDRLGNSGVVPKIILAGLSDLAGYGEKRPLKILQI